MQIIKMVCHKVGAIVSDLDGTLTNSEKHVLPYTRKIIHRAMEQGCQLILASGRPLEGIHRVIEELQLQEKGGYIISYNGCLVTEIKSGKRIYEKKLPQELALKIYDYVKQLKEVNIATYQPGYIYGEKEKDEYLQIEAYGCSIPVTVVKHLPDIMTQGIHKYVITGNPERIKQVRVSIEETFGEWIDTIISEPFYLEIVPKGVNKAAALALLVSYLGLQREDIAAFGDGGNDIEMLKYAGISFAMKNGCEAAKNAAMYLAESNDEDGVGRAVEQYLTF